MRIGFDTTPLSHPWSGIGTYTANLFEHLRRRNGDEFVPLTYVPAGHRWAGYNGSTRKGFFNKTLWMQTMLPHQMSRLELDICHFTNNVGPFWTPCPSVLTLHDMTPWLFPEFFTLRQLLAVRPITPQAVRMAQAVITVSQRTKTDIVRILKTPPEKVYVVYEAPAPYFRHLHPGPFLESIRRIYSLPEHFILHVGTLEPRKNLVRCLTAFAELRRAGIQHHFILVGSYGWKCKEIFAAIEGLGLSSLVHWLGYIPAKDLVAIYNLADALVFPSLYEGFGLPVMEAMACGTAVIASPCGALKEVAADVAEFIEPTNVESIVEGLQRVLHDPQLRAEVGRQGRERSAAYSWNTAAEQTRQIYQQIVG